MFEINDLFVIRPADRSFLDPENFRILKFNFLGFDIISELIKEPKFSDFEFERICIKQHVSLEDAIIFWKTCIKENLFIPIDEWGE